MIRLVIYVFAHFFEEATIAMSGNSEIDVNNYVGPVATIMRFLRSKDGDLSSKFDKVIENNISKTTLKELLKANQTIQTNKRKVFGQLPFEHIFRFCDTLKKVTKN